jgi:hypothetical protein
MNQSRRITTGLILAAMLTACSASQPPGEPEVAQPTENMSAPPPTAEPLEPLPAAPAPGARTGSMVVYVCDDRSGLIVTYEENSALVKLPTGSTMLSRAEFVPNGGGEAYIGEDLALHRNGNNIQLQDGGKLRSCIKSPTSG